MSTYDAFVSYSHAEDRGVALRLRGGVEKFAKPWYRLRALRLFLDVNSLSADPGLWTSIEGALSDAAWFVLVTSPRAADSEWVDREIRWWLVNRSADRLLIVVAEGNLRWDSEIGDFDVGASDALPPALHGALEEEPRWVTVAPCPGGGSEPTEADMRAAAVDVAAAIRGVPKEDLEGVAVAEYRRTRRWIASVIAGLSLLLLAAVAASVIALDQRASAVDQARLALSRQIATVSQEAAASDLNIAMQLAVQAYRTDPNPQTRAALINASTTSPNLVRFLDAGAKVASLAGSGDGKVAVAGLDDGRVLAWPILAGRPRELLRLEDPPTSLVVNRNGSAVVATDESRCLLWDRGRRIPLPVPSGTRCGAAGLSPSGRTVVYSADEMRSDEEWIAVAAPADLAARELHAVSIFSSVAVIAVPSDDRALLMSPGYWQWKKFSNWSGSSSGVGIGAHTLTHLVSADGRFAIVTSGGSRVPIWRTALDADMLEPDLSVEAPLPKQTALALSPDGSRVAVAGPGEIYVAPTRADAGQLGELEAEGPANRPVALTGDDAELVSFVGDSRLLTATGSEIAIWDTEQLDRLAEAQSVPLQPGCTLCSPPSLAVSPNGERVAVVDGFSESGFVQTLTGAPDREALPSSEIDFSYGAPLWKPDGSLVAFPMWQTLGETDLPRLTGALPDDMRAWSAQEGEARELTDAVAADGNAAILVDTDGGVFWRDMESGKLIDASPATPTPASENGEINSAAVSGSARFLAMVVDGDVTVEELPSREVVGRFDTSQFASVAFAGSRLLVQLEDGRLQVWDETGTILQRTLPGNGVGWMATTADGGLVARSGEDGKITLEDLDSGTALGAFRTPGESGFLKTGLAFSPDAHLLIALSEMVVGSDRGTLVRRDISDEALVRTTCAAAGAELTPEQWRAFVGADPPDDLSCH